jgi:hypothetical protein
MGKVHMGVLILRYQQHHVRLEGQYSSRIFESLFILVMRTPCVGILGMKMRSRIDVFRSSDSGKSRFKGGLS